MPKLQYAQLLLRVLRDGPRLCAVRRHVPEDVLADLGQALGAGKRDDGHAQLLRADRCSLAFCQGDGPQDGDGALAHQVLHRLRRGVRLALGVLDGDLNAAAVLQIDRERDRVHHQVDERLVFAGERQHDADQVGLHVRGGGDGELDALRSLRDRPRVHFGEDLPGQLVGVRAVAGVQLEPREPERGGGPGRALAVEVAHQLRDHGSGRSGKRLLVVREPGRPLLGGLRCFHRAGGEADRLPGLSRLRVSVGDGTRGLLLLCVGHLGDCGLHRLRCGQRVAELGLDRGQLQRRLLLEGRVGVLLEQLGELRLRFLELALPRERLALQEPRFVGRRALPEAVDHVREDLHRLVGAARGERPLAAAEDVARGVFVGHLFAVHHDRAGGSAARRQECGDQEEALHCSTCTWASFGGTKRNRESGNPEFTFTSLKTSWFVSPCPLVSTVASTCPCGSTTKTSFCTSALGW